MGLLTITTFLTIDGVMQAPGGPDEDRAGGFELGGWSFPYFSDAKSDAITQWFGRADAFLLGRGTYEIFAASWPNFPDDADPVANRLNTLHKYVVSNRASDLAWGPASVIRGAELPAEVARLKERHDGEIQVHGSAGLAQSLHALGLVDEYRLLVDPVVVGGGKRLFEAGATPAAMALVEARALDKGSVLHVYRPTGSPPAVGEFQMEEGFGLPAE